MILCMGTTPKWRNFFFFRKITNFLWSQRMHVNWFFCCCCQRCVANIALTIITKAEEGQWGVPNSRYHRVDGSCFYFENKRWKYYQRDQLEYLCVRYFQWWNTIMCVCDLSVHWNGSVSIYYFRFIFFFIISFQTRDLKLPSTSNNSQIKWKKEWKKKTMKKIHVEKNENVL